MKFVSIVFTALILSLHSEAALKRKWPLVYEPLAPQKELTTAPQKAEGLEPAWYSVIEGSTVTLKWTAAVGADSYHLQVATDPKFKWLVVNEHFFKGTQYELSGLESGKHYFWRVAGMKSDNEAYYLHGPFAGSMLEAK